MGAALFEFHVLEHDYGPAGREFQFVKLESENCAGRRRLSLSGHNWFAFTRRRPRTRSRH